jgi:Flp pilus assembly pilin Flp
MKMLSSMIRLGRSFGVKQDGPTVTEYAVLLALIVFGVFGLLVLIGAFLKGTCTEVSDGLPDGS